jgi:type IV pilus assembly protein PilW
MSTATRKFPSRNRLRTSGFTLVELMVAMAISLFLIGGMLAILQNVRNTYSAQTKLAQLQDNERLAMTLLANVIQSAGYYPNPYANSAGSALPVSPSFGAAATPVIFGVTNANPQGDTLAVRYAAANGDQIMNCMGQTNTAVAPYLSWENDFAVDANHELTCAVWDSQSNATTAPVAVVTGIQGIAMLYGVDANHGSPGTCVDTYMTATQVTANNDWGNICSVKVTLTFSNPIPPADGTKPTLQFTRIIAVMNQGGVT